MKQENAEEIILRLFETARAAALPPPLAGRIFRKIMTELKIKDQKEQ